MKAQIRIGTRGSQLALYQAELVKTLILEDFPMIDVQLIVIKTSGDMVRRGADYPFDTKRLFTREIEEAMLRHEVDLAVHSAKDLSMELPEGLEIGAVLERENPRDCLVSKDHLKLAELPLGARIGTSSLRRKMQLRRLYPELLIEDVRGNVDTRIRKIEAGDFDAVVLAYAGIKRLGLTHYVSEIFDDFIFYPSPGQGIIAVQNRKDDKELADVLRQLNHPLSQQFLLCERAFLRKLEGGCQLPCGIATRIENESIHMKGALFAIEKSEWVEARLDVQDSAEKAGIRLAEKILDSGGRAILEEIRRMKPKVKANE